MMQSNGHFRGLAIVTGGVLAVSAFVAPAPVKADKSDTLKIGATVLGAAAAVLGAKGKTVPAVIAGAAGYYAYKKGRDEDRKKNDPYYGQAAQYPQYPGTSYPTTYPSYPSNNYPSGTTYPTETTYPTYGNYPTNNYPTTSYPSNSYPTYNEPTYSNYPSGGYGGNNGDCHNGSNAGYNGNYNGGYNGSSNGSYNNGSDRYPSYRAVAPQAAAPRSNNRSYQNGASQKVVLR